MLSAIRERPAKFWEKETERESERGWRGGELLGISNKTTLGDEK